MSNMLRRRHFIQQLGFLAAGMAVIGLDSCKKGEEPSTNPDSEIPDTITCWGDSLTAGAGGTPYPSVVEKVIGKKVNNYGIGGQKARQIAARQGSIPVTLSIQGNAFAGTAAVKVTSISTELLSTPATNNLQTLKGKVANIPCTLSRTATGTNPNQVESYTLTPASSSNAAIPANSTFIPDNAVESKDHIQILWLGRNDTPVFDGLDTVMDACIAYINDPKYYLVIGVLNSVPEVMGTTVYSRITAYNDILKNKYGSNFIPSTPPTAEEMKAVGFTPSATDTDQINKGAFPSGLRVDSTHLNTQGYQIIANRVTAKLKEKNWV